MPIARLNDTDLHYDTCGHGPPLVLTHGSWDDGRGWDAVVEPLSARFEVVTWDRRGHSRSAASDHPGSRDEDADDLAALIEHVAPGPVNAVGNSYGSIVVLALASRHPDLVASAVVHEPPLLSLLDPEADPAISAALADIGTEMGAVLDLIAAGRHRDAARQFVERLVLGPGSWDQLPEEERAVFETNAPTFLDEERDPTSRSIDTGALSRATAPMLLTHGTTSPPWFHTVVTELTDLLPDPRVEVIDGAGHIPHATHPDLWVASVFAFHEGLGTL